MAVCVLMSISSACHCFSSSLNLVPQMAMLLLGRTNISVMSSYGYAAGVFVGGSNGLSTSG